MALSFAEIVRRKSSPKDLSTNQTERAESLEAEGSSTVPMDAVILSLDPGETTGCAIFQGTELMVSGELITKDLAKAYVDILALIELHDVAEVVIEDYRVYGWKTKQHAWSELHTPKLVGVVEVLCALQLLPLKKQPAHVAKHFATDKKLKDWNMYKTGEPHARDAIRHGCYYILFGRL